uniref:Uncharacterized protein n=1 Tax=Meleagris gallopavo TaxID=9103 RepID=A0A803YJD2_MELGA
VQFEPCISCHSSSLMIYFPAAFSYPSSPAASPWQAELCSSPRTWNTVPPKTLSNCPSVSAYVQEEDQELLAHLQLNTLVHLLDVSWCQGNLSANYFSRNSKGSCSTLADNGRKGKREVGFT